MDRELSLSDRVALAFHEAEGDQLSPHELREVVGAEPSALRTALSELTRAGYVIEKRPGQGLRMIESPDRLLEAEVLRWLRSRTLGRTVRAYGVVGSTMDVAARMASRGAEEGLMVVAERQTRGRGRRGASWHSTSGLGLWFSLVLRPDSTRMTDAALARLGVQAVANAARVGLGADARWDAPNDVAIEGRKIAGSLAEATWMGEHTAFVILGIGVNVNHELTDFPPELRESAGSLRMVLDRKISRPWFLARILEQFEGLYYGLDAAR